MEKCPCGSGLTYESCCQPILQGKVEAPTAEALMRARYTAYAKGEIEFIESTHERDQRDEVSIEETRKWSRESSWLGLKILSKEKGGVSDDWGKVEFVATYSQRGLKDSYHEIAEFKKVNGRWFYDKGVVVPTTITREAPKLGRNEPCYCGSGKKYKHCHGQV